MANRYGKDLGRRYGEGSDREDYGRRNYGRSTNYGSNPFNDDDEEYFGSGRMQYGGGYTGGTERDYDTYGRGYGRSESDYSRRGSGQYGSDYPERESSSSNYSSDYESGRYGQSGDYSSGYGRESGQSRYGSGYSGQSGSGRRYGGNRYGSPYRGHGSEEYGRAWSGYPASERGYQGDYEGRGDERGWWDRTADEVASWFGDEDAARRRRMDAREGRGYRGRGPSGYTRSDDRIKEDINDRLTDYDYIDASNINVDVQNGEVTLTGTVESRHEKRLAEDLAEDISGVKNVENRLRVNSSSSGYGQGSSTYSSTSGSTTGTTGMTSNSTETTSSHAKGKSSGT